MSTTAPKLENPALASAIVVAPTVITEGVLAGEVLAASTLLFPAATTVVTPEETRLAAASLTAAEKLPPMLMETIEGRPLRLAAPTTQSIPEMLFGT